ncbi:RNA-binding protein [Quillaja saponaria]|uniref:RNA-binding protein n=1 Tax=Quillaja saponaria TaxID=32244 RepID=A0AAD7LN89_QUISA|nr:RNA-binding protein [Quillaja saponaria]KAJ7960436.1 RNA-binding protein [Quillaja saponaria]
MTKKRKLRSSEPVDTKEPEFQSQSQEQEEQEQKIQEEQVEEQPQSQPQPIQENEQESMAVDETVEEEPPEEEEKEQQEQKEEQGEQHEEAVEASIDTVPSETTQDGANGPAEDKGEEDERHDLDEEPVEMLLEPFTREQLLSLVKQAVEKYPDFSDSVRELADVDPAQRKIFIHGLGWDTTAETLTSVFGKYGQIEDCKAVTDKVSGKSKGYAFILFKHRSGARKALKEPQKKIGNRTTSCQLASAGPVPSPPLVVPPVSEYTQRKIFVSNVAAEIDPRKLLEFFKQYGEIEDGPLGIDKQTGKPKGFALFLYKSVESARKALEEPHKNFEGHTLHCQRAIDGPKPSKPYHQNQNQLQHHAYHHQTPYNSRKEKNKYQSGGAGPGHLMAPSAPAVGFNPGVPAQGLNPALGQALTALLANQGTGLGLGNLIGGLGNAPVRQAGPPAAYGNQAPGSYGNQPGMQAGYQNPQMGHSSVPRPYPGGGAPYMGH